MSKIQILQTFNNELHVSHSQIFNYRNCSLRYFFQYVENRPQERISIALSFGSAIHSGLEMYYKAIKSRNQLEPLEAICERFEDSLEIDLSCTDVPIIYKKGMPDKASAIIMGKAMLKAFYENVDLSGMEIVDVEMPLSARLYTDKSQLTDFLLTGIVDLILRNEVGEITVVDNKTAAKHMAQATADDDNQMTAYSYLLAVNRYVFPTSEVRCRFDLLRKLKKPKFEQVHTLRTAADRKRFAKVANAVLAGIDAKIFMPQPSWMCVDCAYAKACRNW